MTKIIAVAVSPDEARSLRETARAFGQSVNAYIREQLGLPPPPPIGGAREGAGRPPKAKKAT